MQANRPTETAEMALPRALGDKIESNNHHGTRRKKGCVIDAWVPSRGRPRPKGVHATELGGSRSAT